MAEPRVLWRAGDQWRDLTGEVRACAAVTVVSRSGAARFLDVEGWRHDRRALEGGQVLAFDRWWRPLEDFWVTPCGVNIRGAFDWAMGTPIWIVVEGIHENWVATAWGRPVVDAILAKRHPTAPGHPARRCEALHCPRVMPWPTSRAFESGSRSGS